MKKRKTRAILEKYFKKISRHLRGIAHFRDDEDIHQLRVTYKKLRAFLRLIHHPKMYTRKKPVLSKLKKGYRIMGSLRDILLHQQMITEQNFPEGRLPISYLQMLQHRENNLRASLNQFCEQIDIPRIKRKTIASLPKKLKPKDLKKTLRKSVYDIKFGIPAKPLKDRDFHRIRKQIKDLLYNFTHGKHMYGHGKKPRLTKKDEAFLGNMLLSLGRFQDLCSSLQILGSFSTESPTNGKENELLLVKQHWQKEKQALSIALTRQLKMFSTMKLNV